MNTAFKIAATTAALAGIAAVGYGIGYGGAYLCDKLLNRRKSKLHKEAAQAWIDPLEAERQLVVALLSNLNMEIFERQETFLASSHTMKKTIREVLRSRYMDKAQEIKDVDLALLLHLNINQMLDEKLPLAEFSL